TGEERALVTVVPVDTVVLVLSADDDFDDLAGAATLPDLGPLDDDPVAHACVRGLILRRRLARADRVPSAARTSCCAAMAPISASRRAPTGASRATANPRARPSGPHGTS